MYQHDKQQQEYCNEGYQPSCLQPVPQRTFKNMVFQAFPMFTHYSKNPSNENNLEKPRLIFLGMWTLIQVKVTFMTFNGNLNRLSWKKMMYNLWFPTEGHFRSFEKAINFSRTKRFYGLLVDFSENKIKV